MKSMITVVVATVTLSACAGLADKGRSAYPSVSDSASIQRRDYGFRDATRDYPYTPPGW